MRNREIDRILKNKEKIILQNLIIDYGCSKNIANELLDEAKKYVPGTAAILRPMLAFIANQPDGICSKKQHHYLGPLESGIYKYIKERKNSV